ncbi:DUF2726 domain-containing protein [Bacillus cereus]|nr:DUF2726 domain-containing protein [Bacillus cereus]
MVLCKLIISKIMNRIVFLAFFMVNMNSYRLFRLIFILMFIEEERKLIRNTIFDSRTESRIHRYLSRRWKDRVEIFPHIPVRDVINIESQGISEAERESFLKKSNFDFVVTSIKDDEYGKPLLVIEFDGIGGGFSIHGEYISIRDTEDPYRKLKMDCKIRICEEAGLPLIVLSWDETAEIVLHEPFSIIDGIIGKVLWHDEFNRLFYGYNEELELALNQANSREEQQDIIDSFGAGCEIQAEINVNPIANKNSQLFAEIQNRKLIQRWGFQGEKDKESVGYTFFASLNDGQETRVAEKVMVRTVNCSKASSIEVAKDLAELKLWKRVLLEFKRI